MKKLLFLLVIASLLVLPATAMAKKQPTGTTWYVGGEGNPATIEEAIGLAENGDLILVDGTYGPFAGTLVDKDVEIRGLEGAVINDGPELGSYELYQGFRMVEGSDGATISHLQFTVDFPVMNGDGVNGVTVTQCTMLAPIQGISNWRGSGWTITGNEIIDLRTRNGGGIGILIGDYAATLGGVNDNVVSFNTISGMLNVDPLDGGGYNGTGIVLYADYRYSPYLGAEKITGNGVLHNQIDLVSDTPLVVDVWAIELTQAYDDNNLPPELALVIYDNDIAFNDLGGTTNGILFTPAELEGENTLRNNEDNSKPDPPKPGPLGDAFGPGE